MVDCNDNGHAVQAHILDMNTKVDDTLFQRFGVLLCEVCFRHAAVILQRSDCRHKHNAVRLQSRKTALYIKEFLRAQIRAEASLGYCVICEFKREFGCTNGVAAVRDIRKRTAVNYRGVVFERLDKVRVYRVLEQRCHCADSLDIARENRLVVIGIRNENIAEALFQVAQISRKAENCHNFACHGYLEVVLARNAVNLAAHSHNAVAERAVIHIEAALE